MALASSSQRLEPSHDSSQIRDAWEPDFSASLLHRNSRHTLTAILHAARPNTGSYMAASLWRLAPSLQRFPPSHLTARQWTARASAGQYITPVKAAGRLLHFVSPFGDWRDSLYSGTLAGGFYEGREGRDVLQAGLGGGSSATASAQSVRAAVARRLH